MIGRRALAFLCVSLGFIALLMSLRQPDHKLHDVNLSFSVDPAFKGTVEIGVAAADQNPITIRMNLRSGRVSTNADSQWLAERLERCGYSSRNFHISELSAPDGAWSIPCGWTDTLQIKRKDANTGRIKTFSPHSLIRDVVWSPDSTAIAVLVEERRSEYFSRQGILSLLTALQPLQLSHYRLFLYSPQNDRLKELPFPYQAIQGATAAIEWVRG